MAHLFDFSDDQIKVGLADKKLMRRFEQQDQGLFSFMETNGFEGVDRLHIRDVAQLGDASDVGVMATLYQHYMADENLWWEKEWLSMKLLDEASFLATGEKRAILESAGGNPLRYAALEGDVSAFDQLIAQGYKPDGAMLSNLVEEAVQFTPNRQDQHLVMADMMMAAGADPSAKVVYPTLEESPIEHAERLTTHASGDVAAALGSRLRHGVLGNLAQASRPQSDLASPDECMGRRSRGRAM